MQLINSKDFFIADFIDLDLCEKIISEHLNSKDKGRGVIISKCNEVNEDIKKSIESRLSENNASFSQYILELQRTLDKYIEKYPVCNWYSAFTILEGMNIQQYEPNGGYYEWHCERNSMDMPQSSRHLVFITYLNDVTDEGETEFYHQKIKIKPQKGLTVIFPSDWTFTHRGIPSKTQEKYIVTGWFNFYNKE